MLAAQIGALSGTEFAEYFSVAIGTNNLLLVGATTLLVTAFFTLPMHASVPAESRHLPQTQRQPRDAFSVASRLSHAAAT